MFGGKRIIYENEIALFIPEDLALMIQHLGFEDKIRIKGCDNRKDLKEFGERINKYLFRKPLDKYVQKANYLNKTYTIKRVRI